MKTLEHSIQGLIELVKYYKNEYEKLKPIEIYSDELERKRFIERRKDTIREFNQASYGDVSLKVNVKTFLKNILTDNKTRHDAIRFSNAYTHLKDDFVITPDNIEEFIKFHPKSLSTEMKFRILLEHFKKSHYEDALVHMLYTFDWMKPRADKAGEKSYFIDKEDIDRAFKTTRVKISYEMKLEILIQLIYEQTFGNRKIDELLYQRTLEGVSVGSYGLPEGIWSKRLKDVQLPKASDAVSITHMNISIRLEFLSLGSFDDLEDTVMQLIRSNDGATINDRAPHYQGDRQGSDRIVAVKPPLGECYMAWVRIHGRQAYNLEELIRGINVRDPNYEPPDNTEVLLTVLKLIIRGELNLYIHGAQNSGKSTLLFALVDLMYPELRIRCAESKWEALLRARHPFRNIASFQETQKVGNTEGITLKEVYEKSLQTEGEIMILPEIRRDSIYSLFITTGNRGAYATLFTGHTKEANNVPLEMGNSLLTSGQYSSLNEALRSVLATLPVSLQVVVDKVTGARYFNLFEFRPRARQIIDYRQTRGDRHLNLLESIAQNLFRDEGAYDTVPIVKYNFENNRYEKLNDFSKTREEQIYYSLRSVEDRRELRNFKDKESQIESQIERQVACEKDI
ncbi:hypothetical protein [Fusibacter sp. JL216-2]|uniref:hypothetical protein n=1 Tax=Fusibacter sp. JL216-2 TaxID=3071453 RepID=UPI003D333F5F